MQLAQLMDSRSHINVNWEYEISQLPKEHFFLFFFLFFTNSIYSGLKTETYLVIKTRLEINDQAEILQS